MPISGKLMTGAISVNMASKKMVGRDAISMADAIGKAVATHLMMPNMLTFACAGTVGPVGGATSLVVAGIVPKAMTALMVSRAAQLGMAGGGRDLVPLFTAISRGVCMIMQGTVAQGTFAGLAMAGGTAKLTKINSQALKGLILANLAAKRILGRDAVRLADCISFGVVTQLKAGATYTVLVTGAIAPIPPIGPIPMAGMPAVISSLM